MSTHGWQKRRIHIVDLDHTVGDKNALFSRFGGAFSLPRYFGNNWDAFEEVLSVEAQQQRDHPVEIIVRRTKDCALPDDALQTLAEIIDELEVAADDFHVRLIDET